MQTCPDLQLEFPPWRLSGVVYGSLLNDAAALAALGDAVSAPPYKAPPKAPVLYVKPRNTLAASGSGIVVPRDAECLEIGAALGIVIGRTACRVSRNSALEHVAGWLLVADVGVPHNNFYRPNVRFKALDGSCLLGPRVAPRDSLADADALPITVRINGVVAHQASTAGMRRPAAQLISDVSEFMSLHPGDILLLGIAAGAPTARAGSSFEIEAPGFDRLAGRLVADTEETT